MRYVIVIAGIAFFSLWDLIYNDAHYVEPALRELVKLTRYLG